MLKWIGILLGCLTIVWMGLERDALNFNSLFAGIAFASALFAVICPTKVVQASPKTEDISKKIEEVEKRAAQTIDGMKLELQKMEQKVTRSEERCLSYQKLVDVHQQEIEKQRAENQTLSEQLVQKERKLGALHFSRLQPDLFD